MLQSTRSRSVRNPLVLNVDIISADSFKSVREIKGVCRTAGQRNQADRTAGLLGSGFDFTQDVPAASPSLDLLTNVKMIQVKVIRVLADNKKSRKFAVKQDFLSVGWRIV